MKRISGSISFRSTWQIVLSTFILILPAIINGYPLLYSDSATYIVSGHESFIPIDRPFIYGFLVRHISLSYSLWLVIIFQAVITITLIERFLYYFDLGSRKSYATIITVSILCISTGLSNYVSQIMPDIFTGFLLLAYAMLLIEKNYLQRWLLSFIIVASSLMHFSNLPLVSTLSVFAIFVTLVYRKYFTEVSNRLFNYSALIILPWLLLPSLNYFYSGEFFLNKSRHIFFTARLIETGSLNEFFSSNPDSHKYSLFNVKDRLPEKAWQFIWEETSPLYDGDCSVNGGWSNCWIEKETEYNAMIRDVLTTKPILYRFIKISMLDWMRQMTDFDTGHLDRQGESSGLSNIIPRYFNDETCYYKSKQYKDTLYFRSGSIIQRVSVILSAILLIMFASNLIKLDEKWIFKFRLLFSMIVFGLLTNAFYCAALSNPLNRYQGRIIWILPLLLIAILQISGAAKIYLSRDKS